MPMTYNSLVGDMGREPTALTQASAVIASSTMSCMHYRDYFLGWRQQILWLVFKIAGVPFGSLLGVFLLGLLSRRRVADLANVIAMVTMTLINLVLLLLSETGRISFPWSWLVIVGTAGTIALSLALSPLVGRRR